ncbi:hypothetical protein IWW55_002335 [Coemansia sp. RSA 2706]|nr:hypothetical protein IWW55_002335 [Coemansia sp. RSA 2706]KAJ2311966.1 hypothetical protein IWW54_002356 [Coemansia sp. RSA 2705]KAJ2318984.1 hypothetical protein IWW52_002234 [Coemansia sp. RSA 2704]KAJ2327307.1 hypothetical protein IWW51_001825 [Coemansia sp. RSA 2702]KAJ2735865.1 hypothetical protein H4R23_002118 [Coemansia sp. Cherry 401B]
MSSSDEFDEASDYYSIINTSDEEGGGDAIGRQATVEAETTDGDEDEEIIEISSSTHGVGPPMLHQQQQQGQPMMQFRVPGRTAAQDVEVSVVSLARYTFADPVVAAEGPAPLEPPLETMRIGHEGAERPTGVGQGGQPLMRRQGPDAVAYGEYDEEGLIAEFTEDRCNRRLARIARRLLLPDSYVEACYDLHEFMATQETSFLAIESVQRNVFKCLKICARLSKLHGYSIQHMWQVIQQAHKRIHEFTAPRAHTIELWNLKLSNRIRMMAVSPAADGSAPQRLPAAPPPELLNAQARDRLLPLPELSAHALNDRGFNRAQGQSSASYYLANPIKQPPEGRRILPPISELTANGTPQGPGATSSAWQSRALTRPQTASDDSDSPDDEQPPQHGSYTVEEPASDIFALTAQAASAVAGSDEPSTALTTADADSLASTREAELAIIEHQLRELERTPVHRMGPMMRAALNLLVEMRFRLQLGLPRSAQNAENPLTAPLRIPGTQHSSGSNSTEAYGDGMSEERVIEYVLDQISTTRRTRREQMAAANGGTALAAPGGAGGGFGAPLYMMPHHAGMFYPGMAAEQPRSAYQPQTAPRSELRRRRDGDSDDEEEESESEPSPSSEDDFDADGDLEVEDASPLRARRARSGSTRRMPETHRRRLQRRRRRT